MDIEKRDEEDLKQIKEWLSKQSHLPQNIDNLLLLRFLHCSNHSLEKAKHLIDLCYTLRSQSPEIFSNRDPEDENIKNIFKVIDLIPLPKVNEKNYKLFIYRLCDTDSEKYHFNDAIKAFFMMSDTRMATETEIQDGEVPIFDMNGFTLKHLTRMNLSIIKKYMVYTQEAHPIRLKEIHVVNIPPFLDRCLAIVKPFMKSEVASMLHFHLPNSKTLHDHVPADLLPEEYGGKVGKIVDLKREWLDKIRKKRDYFLDENRWNVDETKRPIESRNRKQNFGLQGSFRSLNID